MTVELALAFVLFAFVSSITPGPNNLMLLASGANFGAFRSVPHMLGVNLGFTLMVVVVGLGIMQIFEAVPLVYQILQVLCVLYLLYLAFKIATAGSAKAKDSQSAKPISFFQAVLFQWVNPKAWTMAVTAISVYAPDQTWGAILIIAVMFGIVNLPSICAWTLLGQKMQRLLSHPNHLRTFNVIMALLLVSSLYPMMV